MKKLVSYLMLAGMVIGVVSCGGPENSKVPSQFARKHMIEHYTGEDCGYCPDGMDAIAAFIAEHPNTVWLSNHYGYGTDEYSIKASETVGTKMGVEGAPSITLDRDVVKWTYNGQKGGNTKTKPVFHPGYLENLTTTMEDSACASVKIENTYDAAAGQLTIHVSGMVGDTAIKSVQLTVAVKESGLHGKQKDFYKSWEGWSDFVHTHVVRVYATEALGDEIAVVKQKYDVTYTVDWNKKWNADNSSVVAFIAEGGKNYPIINADEAPVVFGTKGGSDIKHGGVTLVPVDDTYPEEGSPLANIAFQQIQTQSSAPFVLVQLASSTSVRASGYTCNPYVLLYLNTGDGKLNDGVYTVSNSGAANTIYAGYRDDEAFEINGSLLYYVYQGQYVISQWMIVGGSLTVANNGTSITGSLTTLNGSEFTVSYGAAGKPEVLPLLAPKKNKLGVCAE